MKKLIIVFLVMLLALTGLFAQPISEVHDTAAPEISNNRVDFKSDEAFANFRAIEMGNIGEGKLYRSESPINAEPRAPYANTFVEEAQIKSVLNLEDTEQDIQAFIAADGFNSEYYAKLFANGCVVTATIDAGFSSDEFGKELVEGLKKLLKLEGPVLIHSSGKIGYTNFTTYLLGALMGADKYEIIVDYLKNGENLYRYEITDNPGIAKL